MKNCPLLYNKNQRNYLMMQKLITIFEQCQSSSNLFSSYFYILHVQCLHALNGIIIVSVPPVIEKVTSGGLVEVKKGTKIVLECKTSGIPPPTITWTRRVRSQIYIIYMYYYQMDYRPFNENKYICKQRLLATKTVRVPMNVLFELLQLSACRIDAALEAF